MLGGILAGLTTGALWGLNFIAPLAVAPYSGVDLAIARYVIFALTSIVVLIAIPAARAAKLAAADVLLGIGIGLVGYGAFYSFLVVAIGYAGPQIAALVIGLLPVLLAIIGNFDGGRLPWRALAAPLILILAGLLLVHGSALLHAETGVEQGRIAAGILAALGAVASWVCFSVFNARALARVPQMNSLTWTSLHGIGAGVGILVFGALALPFGVVGMREIGFDWPEASPLLMWAILTGLFGSWGASYLWVIATKRLPLVISGQLFVAEPAFGFIYGFMWEQRWPSPVESFGGMCVFGGVMLGLAAFGRHRRTRTGSLLAGH
ncbi:DMT family transporter [Terrihabitans sp. B22-R8]|uniref:DMT family transporter n=1 Tax=Terrihabitans sp. B22-R8 TaxID=3425128 RepID=UPI00403C50C9